MGSHTCWLSYFKMVCLWCGWMVARSLDRSVYGHVITKFSGMDRLPHSLAMGLCPRARFASRPPGGGGGTPDFKWLGWLNGGKTQNPKKSLHQNLTPQKSHAAFPNHKIFEKALNDITRKIQTLVWNTKKNSYLNQATPKKYLPKFFFPEKLFDHPCHLKSRVPPPPLPGLRPNIHIQILQTHLHMVPKRRR